MNGATQSNLIMLHRTIKIEIFDYLNIVICQLMMLASLPTESEGWTRLQIFPTATFRTDLSTTSGGGICSYL